MTAAREMDEQSAQEVAHALSRAAGYLAARGEVISSSRERWNTERVAWFLNVQPATVYSYVSRGTMPAGETCPCCGSGPTWDKAEIEQWAASRPGRTGRPKK